MKNLYPLFLYLYNKDGFYSNPERISDKDSLELKFKTSVKQAIEEKREVRITDSGDDMVFHSFRGHIKWDGTNAHVCSECQQSDDPGGRK